VGCWDASCGARHSACSAASLTLFSPAGGVEGGFHLGSAAGAPRRRWPWWLLGAGKPPIRRWPLESSGSRGPGGGGASRLKQRACLRAAGRRAAGLLSRGLRHGGGGCRCWLALAPCLGLSLALATPQLDHTIARHQRAVAWQAATTEGDPDPFSLASCFGTPTSSAPATGLGQPQPGLVGGSLAASAALAQPPQSPGQSPRANKAWSCQRAGPVDRLHRSAAG